MAFHGRYIQKQAEQKIFGKEKCFLFSADWVTNNVWSLATSIKQIAALFKQTISANESSKQTESFTLSLIEVLQTRDETIAPGPDN